MTPSTYILLISLFLFNQLKAQGTGCFFTTCPGTGQVRRNAIYTAHGEFIGGCNCGCPVDVYDPASLRFCAEPNAVNFDPLTLIGDCSCGPKVHGTTPTTPAPAPITLHLPIPMPAPALPLPWSPPQLPTLAPPSGPTGPPVPPRAIEVVCNLKGPCSCPIGHVGECNIYCEGDPDACKDTIIECNNDGYPCNIHCNSPNACGGSANIIGPVGSSLEVTCLGIKSCEGSTQFNGNAGTDMTVICDGMTSCKGGQFNFGSAVSYVECNGEPDSCLSAVFNLFPNARTTPGAAYSCVGSFCPEPGTGAPEPFSNVIFIPGECAEVGPCSCSFGANKPCDLKCEGSPDACKDGVILCNSDGFACVVNCISEQACSGAAMIVGPKGASLTVNCIGAKACEGSTIIDAAASTDVTVFCEGRESCKGSVEIDFGTGVSAVYCNGIPDSCGGLEFNLLPNAETMPGAGFSCNGHFCPPNAPRPFLNTDVGLPAPQTPVVPVDIVPGYPAPQTPVVPVDIIPGYLLPVGVVPSPAVPAPAAPLPAAPVASPYCCRTSIPAFKPWAGRCWDETTEAGCISEPNGRCVWEPSNCLPNPPINANGHGPCKFYETICAANSDCCSETCNANGLCR